MQRAVRVSGWVLLWLITALEAVGIGASGIAKFSGTNWLRLFVGWGYPAWFSYVVGMAEVVGALCLLVPRLASYAAGLLATVMVGAVATLLTHPGSMGWRTPAVNVVLLSIVAVARWKQRLGAPPASPP